jgi:hypothetical protein
LSQVDDRPGHRGVWVLLIIITLFLSVFFAPPDAEGDTLATSSAKFKISSTIDGLAFADKCLTQNQKALNCGRLEVVSPAGSESPFYSRCTSLKTVISKP